MAREGGGIRWAPPLLLDSRRSNTHNALVTNQYDAVVVGSGPNGLAAAVEVARRGGRVVVYEAADTIGGGTRTTELTESGYLHDVCSAVHPLGAASPFFRSLPLEDHGLEWLHFDIPITHPLDGGEAAVLHHSLVETAVDLGPDESRYEKLLAPLVEHFDDLLDDVLGPLVAMPSHPIRLSRFGVAAMLPATLLARRFSTARAKALLAGLAAHSVAPLDRPFTSAIGIVLGAAGHVHGWPIAKGGSAAITGALADYLGDLGGEIVTGYQVESLDALPSADSYLLDVMPAAAVAIAGDRIGRSRGRLESWAHGPGVFKVDWALDQPIPWTDPWSTRAGTVHVGGTIDEVVAAESAAATGRLTDRPFVLVSQPTLIDPTRAPQDKHVAWAYCHVPNGSPADMTLAIETQIERFAPGFRDTIIARHTMSPAAFATYNVNYVGGDIGGGALNTSQLVARPRLSSNPYRIGRDVYLCSSATPPGAGVHGMCGYHAATAALEDAAER